MATPVVIPESVDKSLQVETAASHYEADSPALPSIIVFLSKTCTILLIHCDFEQIKKTVEQQTMQNKGEVSTGDQIQEENTCTNSSQDTAGIGMPDEENNQPEIRTSARKQTIIDYKKFLEEYADKPPSPPKKKREVDLKRKPSKTRIAAEKYSQFFIATPSRVPGLGPAPGGFGGFGGFTSECTSGNASGFGCCGPAIGISTSLSSRPGNDSSSGLPSSNKASIASWVSREVAGSVVVSELVAVFTFFV